jgi:hypothetical protein
MAEPRGWHTVEFQLAHSRDSMSICRVFEQMQKNSFNRDFAFHPMVEKKSLSVPIFVLMVHTCDPNTWEVEAGRSQV